MSRLLWTGVTLLLLTDSLVAAYMSYQSKIPNGASVMRNGSPWAGVGHLASGGSGTRNQFGLDFAAASHTWTVALCDMDSDGDGQHNGLELGDPSCTWTEGMTPFRTSDISHPGFSDSTTTASAPGTPAPPPPTPVPTPTPAPPTPAPTPLPPGDTIPATTQTNVSSGVFTVEGYLSDIYCVDRIIALDGPNMITNPKGHSKHCAVLSVCIPGGYTILTPPTSTTQTAYGPMYNLTTAGNTEALTWLKTLPESQTNLLVKITGKYTSDGKFEIVGASTNTFGDSTSSTSSGVFDSTSSASSPASNSPLEMMVAFIVFALIL